MNRYYMYIQIENAASWANAEKRKVMFSSFKQVCVQENSKYLFVVLDNTLKWLDQTYARSQFRRDFAKRFRDTPLTERETKALQPDFDEKINECFNEAAEVKPLRYVPPDLGPFVSYDESILGITPRQRRIRTLARVAASAAVVAVMAAVIVCFTSKRRKNR